MKHFAYFLVCYLYSSLLFGQTTLQYNFSKGDVFKVKQEAQQIITQELDGTSHEITNTINGILEFKVASELEESYIIELTFKDLNLTMSSNIQGNLMNVNAKEVIEGDMQSQIFNSLLNNTVLLTLTRTGDILGVTGGDSLVAKMAEASGIQDEFSLDMMKKSLESEFGSNALSNSYKQMTYFYPTEAMAVGDSWENNYEGKLSAKNSWTLNKVTDKNASITGKADIVMAINEPATTMALTGTQETTIITDLLTGFILNMKVDGISEGTSTIVQMGDQQITTILKSTITYQLINE